MGDDHSCKPPPPTHKKKKKKKKSRKSDSTSPKDADKPEPPVLLSITPPQPPLPKLKASPKKDSKKGSRKSKKPLLLAPGSSVESFLSRLSGEARETVRWEGALEDPEMEEQRLEVYKANRRERYVQEREGKYKA
ncbi:unnamed protein product [Knipowitschia caucasica]|uniref:Uncharacterized protein n=1 Tax=Knipowitschia caucasica TaxID=637954 RepID=A0AAV2JBL3_KNICA